MTLTVTRASACYKDFFPVEYLVCKSTFQSESRKAGKLTNMRVGVVTSARDNH